MLQLCSCTQSPAAIGWLAKPMIWPNFLTGSPTAIGLRRDLVAERDALAGDDALGRHGILLDPLAGDQDVVLGAEAKHARTRI